MSLFKIAEHSQYLPKQVPLALLAGENTVTIKPTHSHMLDVLRATTNAQIAGMEGDDPLAKMDQIIGLNTLASLIVDWEGPVFGSVACTPENVISFLTELLNGEGQPAYRLLQFSTNEVLMRLKPELEDVSTTAKKSLKSAKLTKPTTR